MENNAKKKNTIYILIAIPVIGFLLLNLMFIFDALFQMLVDQLFPIKYHIINKWFPLYKHLAFVGIIAIISWFVFKSKLKDIYKAIYIQVPTAVILVTIGIFFHRWPIVAYGICGLLYGGIILYLHKTKKSWFYIYSITIVATALFVMGILGIDI